LYDYIAHDENCLSLTEGEIIANVSWIDDHWATGQNFDGKTGLIPRNCCEVATARLLILCVQGGAKTKPLSGMLVMSSNRIDVQE